MKLILALLFAAPLSAFAAPFIMGTATNYAGGANFLMGGVTECQSSLEVVVNVPFKNPIRGCVTQTPDNFKTLHVVFEDGAEVDYSTASFTAVNQPKKGAL